MPAGWLENTATRPRAENEEFMSKLRSKASPVILGIALWAVAMFPVIVPSAAAESQMTRSLDAVGQQRLLSQMLVSDLTLLHLGMEGKAPRDRAKGYLVRFSQLHNGLLYGDPKLGLTAEKSTKITGHLQKINEAWLLFSAAVKAALNAKSITTDHLESISGLSEALYDTTTKARQAYHSTKPKRLHSQLDIAIETAEGQISLTQKMIKEYLLIAARHKQRKNRALLNASYTLFDRALKGLIHGDAGQNLLEVPDPEVQKRLAAVEATWDKSLTLLKPAAVDKTPGQATIADTLNLNRQLMNEMTAAVVAYRKL